jgi:hypothetical protein
MIFPPCPKVRKYAALRRLHNYSSGTHGVIIAPGGFTKQVLTVAPGRLEITNPSVPTLVTAPLALGLGRCGTTAKVKYVLVGSWRSDPRLCLIPPNKLPKLPTPFVIEICVELT